MVVVVCADAVTCLRKISYFSHYFLGYLNPNMQVHWKITRKSPSKFEQKWTKKAEIYAFKVQSNIQSITSTLVLNGAITTDVIAAACPCLSHARKKHLSAPALPLKEIKSHHPKWHWHNTITHHSLNTKSLFTSKNSGLDAMPHCPLRPKRQVKRYIFIHDQPMAASWA